MMLGGQIFYRISSKFNELLQKITFKKEPYGKVEDSEHDSQDEKKEQEELENIRKMKVILRELSVVQIAPQVKAYPTFKYIHAKSSSAAPRSSYSMG